MTDKELLEAAAKAAGLVVVGIDDSWVRVASEGCKGGLLWNPLVNDGDALRLAVKLNIVPRRINSMVFAWRDCVCDMQEPCGEDALAATRRAIVRAAAMAGDS